MRAAATRSVCWTRWRSYRTLSQIQYLGWPFPAPSDGESIRSDTLIIGPVYSDGSRTDTLIFQGRDNGIVYWGDFAKKVKVSVGAFDAGPRRETPKPGAARSRSISGCGGRLLPERNVLRRQDLLAIGGATQLQSGHTAITVTFSWKRNCPAAARLRRSEYPTTTGWCGYDSNYAKSQGRMCLALHLSETVGVGKFEISGKLRKAEFTHGKTQLQPRKTTSELQLCHQAVQCSP